MCYLLYLTTLRTYVQLLILSEGLIFAVDRLRVAIPNRIRDVFFIIGQKNELINASPWRNAQFLAWKTRCLREIFCTSSYEGVNYCKFLRKIGRVSGESLRIFVELSCADGFRVFTAFAWRAQSAVWDREGEKIAKLPSSPDVRRIWSENRRKMCLPWNNPIHHL